MSLGEKMKVFRFSHADFREHYLPVSGVHCVFMWL